MPGDLSGGGSGKWHRHPILAVFVGGTLAILAVGFVIIPLIATFVPNLLSNWGNKGNF